MDILEQKYDSNYKPTKQEIADFPDIQNGPSAVIKGANVAIHQVGTHNFRLPLKYQKRNGKIIELETKKNTDLFKNELVNPKFISMPVKEKRAANPNTACRTAPRYPADTYKTRFRQHSAPRSHHLRCIFFFF